MTYTNYSNKCFGSRNPMETIMSIEGDLKLNIIFNYNLWGFLGGSDDKESAYNAGDPGSIPGWEDPLEKGMATRSSILAWRIPWRGAW